MARGIAELSIKVGEERRVDAHAPPTGHPSVGAVSSASAIRSRALARERSTRSGETWLRSFTKPARTTSRRSFGLSCSSSSAVQIRSSPIPRRLLVPCDGPGRRVPLRPREPFEGARSRLSRRHRGQRGPVPRSGRHAPCRRIPERTRETVSTALAGFGCWLSFALVRAWSLCVVAFVDSWWLLGHRPRHGVTVPAPKEAEFQMPWVRYRRPE